MTAIGYHGRRGASLWSRSEGRRTRLFSRVVRRLFGTEGGLTYYKLGGESGADTSALDVGAPPGTDVYSPVDGTVVGITPYVVSEKTLGARIDVQPAAAPSLSSRSPTCGLTPRSVGSSVAAARSKIGSVLDSRVERQALARYTQDAGNHVSVEVHRRPPWRFPEAPLRRRCERPAGNRGGRDAAAASVRSGESISAS